MKNLIALSTFLFIANLSIAQTASIEHTDDLVVTKTEKTNANGAMSAMNKAIVKELSLHLKRTLKVPERMKEFNIEGKALVNVHIDPTGSISKVDIVKSLNSSLDRAITKSLSKVKSLHAVKADGTYHAQIVQLPVIIKH